MTPSRRRAMERNAERAKVHFEGSMYYTACGRPAEKAKTSYRRKDVTCKRCLPLADSR